MQYTDVVEKAKTNGLTTNNYKAFDIQRPQEKNYLRGSTTAI